MTTTQHAWPRVREIVDEYLRQRMDGIFSALFSPYGFAVRRSNIAYNRTSWLKLLRGGVGLHTRHQTNAERGSSSFTRRSFSPNADAIYAGYVD